MRRERPIGVVMVLGLLSSVAWGQAGASVARPWSYASETSAVVFWQLPDIKDAALSYVEYGTGHALDQKTAMSVEPRWTQFHRLTGLDTGTQYSFRMVNVHPETKAESRSAVMTFTTARKPDAIHLPGNVPGPPYVLNQPGATYVLTRDITTPGTALVLAAPNVTVDLDGHTVTFGDDTDQRAYGAELTAAGPVAVCNGHIAQGRRSAYYSAAVGNRRRGTSAAVFGISTDVHLKCAYPINLARGVQGLDIHHNNLYSRVTELESRHYPGNALCWVSGSNVHIHDNLFTEGCHFGIELTGDGPKVEVDYNDIRHHQQYVNGYAFMAHCPGADIHHNRVTSTGRSLHMTRERISFHDNYLDTKGHMTLSDLPQGSRPFRHQRVTVHGVKFEGARATACKVYNNFMRSVQEEPVDSQGRGLPDDKIRNGVYIRSKATAIAADKLTDATQDWEKDRWANYWVKYAPDRPAVRITGNDATTLSGTFEAAPTGEYTIYQKWSYVPPSPLNISCFNPNGMNEVYNNTFVALTTSRRPSPGRGYGRAGDGATAVSFVGMSRGPAEPDKYAIYLHHNTFISNDVFVSGVDSNMTIRIENNTFQLADEPPPTETHRAIRGTGPLTSVIKAGHNTFEGMQP